MLVKTSEMPFNKRIGIVINVCRNYSHLIPSSLARKSRTNTSTILAAEYGRVSDILVLSAIAKGLGVKLSDIIRAAESEDCVGEAQIAIFSASKRKFLTKSNQKQKKCVK